MTEIDVRIVKLEPMRVAAVLGFGEQPEMLAWNKLLAWANPLGLIDDLETVRFFGFNNPDPSPGSPNYGYEQWIVVGPDVKASSDIKIKDFDGGLYAVTRCTLNNIGETWQQLVLWLEDSKYHKAQHQWLEGTVKPEMIITPDGMMVENFEAELDLYLPIAE